MTQGCNEHHLINCSACGDRERRERRIATLESNLRDLNTLYIKSLDNVNNANDWWHKEWHSATGIPCDGSDEYCPLSRMMRERGRR
jgi:hypothetical protein